MFGNILLGSTGYAGATFGIYVTEIAANISNSTITTKSRVVGTLSSYPSIARRTPELDIDISVTRKEGLFVPKISSHVYGTFDEFGTECYAKTSSKSYATFKIGEGVLGNVSTSQRVFGYFSFEFADSNAIRWSKIGALDFTIDQSNLAGKAPVEWSGYVYAIKQLGKGSELFVFGANGITLLQAVDVSFGQRVVSTKGIKSKHAVVATDNEIYFIFSDGELGKISAKEGAKKLGYDYIFSGMSEIIMTWDKENSLIYICDGSSGYVYSILDDALTEGPNNITGFSFLNGAAYITAPSNITNPNLLLASVPYDFGTRKNKTVLNVEISTDYSGVLYAAVEYRINNSVSFESSPWVRFNPDGFARLHCYGIEFKIKVKSDSLADFNIYWLRVNGQIHDYRFTDKLTYIR